MNINEHHLTFSFNITVLVVNIDIKSDWFEIQIQIGVFVKS